MSTTSVPGAGGDPVSAEAAAKTALPSSLDLGALGQIARDFQVPLNVPLSPPGAEGELTPTYPPMSGIDPRGTPSAAWAVAAGSVPGGTGAPGYYFLPAPGGGSPVMPGDLQAGGGTPPGPSTTAVPEGAATASPAGAPPLPEAGLPAAPAAPPSLGGATPGAAAGTGTPGVPGMALDPFTPALDPLLPTLEPVLPAVEEGAAPAPPSDAPKAPSSGPEPVPSSPEDEVALRLATDLMQQITPAATEVQEEPLREAGRVGAVPHLPTTDAAVRDMVAAAMGPTLPEAPAAPAPAAADYYFVGEPEAPQSAPVSSLAFDVHAARRDFPILHQNVNGQPLAWMDNAATTQKPQAVIDALSRYYARDNSNIHRGAHTLAARATEAYESARDIVRRFIGAALPEEIVFARGTTEAINLVAQAWGRKYVREGDEIILTQLEHHANIVPWQMLAQEKGAVLRVVPITDSGEVVLEEYARLLGPRTRIVAVSHVSNALGTVVPVEEMIEAAHRHGVPVLVDGAQSVAHVPTDVQAMGADFYVFSGHKIYAPMGVGALYARKELLEDMPPWQGGGSMIRDVTFERTIYEDPPAKFEAGTPTVGDAVGLGASLEYLERLGLENVIAYEDGLLQYATERLLEVPGIRLIGTAPRKVSVLSFVLEGADNEDVGRYLDSQGIAVRAGHHCAQPTMRRYGLEGTVRPSLALYNTHEEVDRLVEALKRFRPA